MQLSQHPRRRVVLALSLIVGSVISVFAGVAPTAEASSGNNLAVSGEVVGLAEVHGCTVRSDQTLECWGSNSYGQLGTGSTAAYQSPVETVGLFGVETVATAQAATCAVTVADELWCWGWRDQVPDGFVGGPVTTPVNISAMTPGLTGVKGVALAEHGCAVLNNGQVWCWGDNDNGKLGQGTVGGSSNVPVQVPGITDAIQVGVDGQSTCVLHATGSTSCFGSSFGGTFGPGFAPQDWPTPQLTAMEPGVALAMGSVVCILTGGGEVYCYGGNAGNVGNNTGEPAANLDDAVKIASGAQGVCAIRANGRLACWGGVAAVGVQSGSFVIPTDIPGETDVTAVSMAVYGGGNMCFSRGNGTVACLGRDPLGLGLSRIFSPTQLPGVIASDVSVGSGHACALTASTPNAQCWGAPVYITGPGSGPLPLGPTPVSSIGSSLTALAAGETEICGAPAGGGTLNCLGVNTANQLVVTPVTGFPSTIEKLDLSAANGLFFGPQNHKCAISDSEVWCAGTNSQGQLGTNSTTETTVAVKAQHPFGSADAVDVTTGFAHTCSLDADGLAWCWGRNTLGQLGDGTTDQRNVPTPVTGLPASAVVSLAAGSSTTCAALANGEAWCWGANSNRQLGQDDPFGTGPSSSPVPLKVYGTGSSGAEVQAVQVAVGDDTVCLRTTSGEVRCWGAGDDGALGRGTGGTYTPGATSPIPGFTATDIDAFYNFAGNTFCALSTGGTVWCWGHNRSGVTGVPPESATPVEVNITGVAAAATTTTTTTPTTTAPSSTTTTTPPRTTDPGSGTTSTTVTPTTVPTGLDIDVFSPIPPARLLETRSGPGLATVDGSEQGAGRRAAGSTTRVRLASRAGVTADARAVVINVTAINPSGPGFLTIHPCLADLPTAASLNYVPGSALGNEVVAALDATGDVCVYTSAEADLAIDAVAFVSQASPYSPTQPTRLADTRLDGATADGAGPAKGRVLAGAEIVVQVTGRAGIPAGTAAAILNIAAVAPSGVGFVTTHPCVDPRPLAASLNFREAINRSNEIIAPLDADGRVCVYTSAEAHLVVDVVGSMPAGSKYSPITPSRFLDTRPAGTTIDAQFAGSGPNPDGGQIRLRLAGRGDIPVEAKQVSLYLSAINPSSIGFATVHPCLDTRPNASSLNFATGVNGGNDLIVELDAAGDICVYTDRSTHLSVDVAGFTT